MHIVLESPKGQENEKTSTIRYILKHPKVEKGSQAPIREAKEIPLKKDPCSIGLGDSKRSGGGESCLRLHVDRYMLIVKIATRRLWICGQLLLCCKLPTSSTALLLLLFTFKSEKDLIFESERLTLRSNILALKVPLCSLID